MEQDGRFFRQAAVFRFPISLEGVSGWACAQSCCSAIATIQMLFSGIGRACFNCLEIFVMH